MLGQAVCGDGIRAGSETWDGSSKVLLPVYNTKYLYQKLKFHSEKKNLE